MPLTSRRFFTTKPRIGQLTTLELTHPAFGVRRYVGNQYFEKTIGGEVYQPAAMTITESVQDERNSISYNVQLGRVGSQAKVLSKAIDKYPLGWMVPIEGTVKYWLANDLSTPFRQPVTLTVGGFVIDGDSVAITLDTANPRGQAVARRYNGNDFPGTKAKI